MRSSPVFEMRSRRSWTNGHLPLVIGGDCPLLLGCLAASSGRDRVGLLFVDGHEDAYLPMQSSTGEAADMELAFALGMADASWSPELAALLPLVAPADVRILGARDAEFLRAEGVASLRDRVALVDGERLAADPAGIRGGGLRRRFPSRGGSTSTSTCLSTQALPAIDYPQPGGLDWDDLAAVATTALSADPRGWDVTIYNPDLDPTRVHARRIVRFLGTRDRAGIRSRGLLSYEKARSDGIDRIAHGAGRHGRTRRPRRAGHRRAGSCPAGPVRRRRVRTPGPARWPARR